MTQDAVMVLLLKIGLIGGFAALLGWVTVYHVLTGGGWRHNPLGRTLVVKSLLIAGLFVPTTLSLFFHLTRNGSRIAGWADVALIGAVAPVMWWRAVVMLRLGRAGRDLHGGDDGKGSGSGG